MGSKKESFFWTSYSDLMTSLFFVMLVLFVLTIALLHKRMVATQEQLDKIKQMQKATEKIDPNYFAYDQTFKRHTLKNIVISFRTQSADMTDIDEDTQKKLLNAGKSIRNFMLSAQKQLPEANYLLIIEGQSSKDNYKKNFELSYERALHLVQFWDNNNISFDNMKNCELLISGSGYSSKFRAAKNKDNQRFVIHVIPKPCDFSN